MTIYEPPAGIDDFSKSKQHEALRNGWHENTTKIIAKVKSSRRASPLFFDQLADKSGVPDGPPHPVPWNGFPLRLDKWFRDDAIANRQAEVILRGAYFGLYEKDGSDISLPFRIQDEYCEWHVDRSGPTVTRISFTCEPPEYWEHLAKLDFDLVHQLYETLLEAKVPPNELRWGREVFDNESKLRYGPDDYNPWNVWNTEKGAVHLTHPANSLYAEIALASDSTLGWPIEPDARGNIDEIEIMCCAGVGGINRSSDPLILKGVFGIARQGLSVALLNPIGLYISPFDLAGLLDPKDQPIGDKALKFVRQSADGSRILRAEVRPPQGATYGLEQCSLDGVRLETGGQIARGITMRLFGTAKKIPGQAARPVKACTTFCCAHPIHVGFRDTFPVGAVKSCAAVTKDEWKQGAYDIPDGEPGGWMTILADKSLVAKPHAVLAGDFRSRGRGSSPPLPE